MRVEDFEVIPKFRLKIAEVSDAGVEERVMADLLLSRRGSSKMRIAKVLFS